MVPHGIESATYGLEEQCLNLLRHNVHTSVELDYTVPVCLQYRREKFCNLFYKKVEDPKVLTFRSLISTIVDVPHR